MSDEKKPNKAIRLIGLDVETTGLDPYEYEICQIGLYLPGHEPYVKDVECDPLVADAEALAVNGFTPERLTSGEPDYDVDIEICNWLEDHHISLAEHVLIPVGWNVGSFDIQFIKRTFFTFYKSYVSHRALDLNSLCFAMMDKWEGSTHKDFNWYKEASKEYAVSVAEQEKREVNWHDAGFDAWASMQALKFLKNEMSKYI